MSDPLHSLSAVDGRYRSKTAALSPYFSESALIRYRVAVESRWLLFLGRSLGDSVLSFSESDRKILESLTDPLKQPESLAAEIKEIEAVTNHDVKACEYYLRKKLESSGAKDNVLSYIHFACTSEDINNTAYAMMLRDSLKAVIVPSYKEAAKKLSRLAVSFKDQPMLARTHGQSASPTTLGKEVAVFSHRIQKLLSKIEGSTFGAKFNGAVGNYSAHSFAFPEKNWPELSKNFIERDLGLDFNPATTQIENHDSLCELLDDFKRMHSVLVGLCRDVWTYVSLGYFKQKLIEGEVGSSTMPHKVNPIDFENAEGNFGLANGLCSHLSEKLLISRMQRDLTDSTVLRSLGTAFGYSMIACASLVKGLGKLEVNRDALDGDLRDAWEVLAEPVQTLMRAKGVVNAYEILKKETRGQMWTKENYQDLVKKSDVFDEAEKKRLLDLKPSDYVGLAVDIVQTVETC
ncbi:adenylosuccinate lyase [Oligoflexaceae bacterium]|nr:adenylosuccinate lyase [Oligoflexaceae bacterium]